VRSVAIVAVYMLAACSADRMHVTATATVPSGGTGTGVRVVIRAPRDLRPALEREGETTHLQSFLFLGLLAFGSSQGNEVSRPQPTLAADFAAALGAALARIIAR